MKTFYILAAVIPWALCGCTESAHERAMNKQIAELQVSLNSLSNSIVAVQEEANFLSNSIPDLTAVGKIVSQTNNEPAFVGPMFDNPDAVRPTGIDPGTGLPYSEPSIPSLVVFPANGRVTEVSDLGWQWAVWFAAGNPTLKSQTRIAHIKFMDGAGHVIDSENKCVLTIPAVSTNFFVTKIIINQSEAKKVKSVQADLNSFVEDVY